METKADLLRCLDNVEKKIEDIEAKVQKQSDRIDEQSRILIELYKELNKKKLKIEELEKR